jgi:hypothetical protein
LVSNAHRKNARAKTCLRTMAWHALLHIHALRDQEKFSAEKFFENFFFDPTLRKFFSEFFSRIGIRCICFGKRCACCAGDSQFDKPPEYLADTMIRGVADCCFGLHSGKREQMEKYSRGPRSENRSPGQIDRLIDCTRGD